MFRKMVFRLGLFVLFAGIASPLLASDQTFPIGLWVADPLNMWSDSVRMKKGFDLEWLAALRWQGMNVGTAGNGEVPWLTFKLAKYDSVAFRIWLVAAPFHSSRTYLGRTQNQYLDISGRDPFAPFPTQRYFTSYADTNSNRDPSKFRDSLRFDAYLGDTVVPSVVDSVKNAHALWNYFYWDEPNNFHATYYQDQNKQYWRNIWWGPDQSCSQTDSRGVHSWLKWKIEHRDSLHKVCINLGGAYRNNAAASLCNAKYQNLQGDTFPNKMQSFSYDTWPYFWGTRIGDTNALKTQWTDVADSMVAIGKRTNPADPVPVYDTQLQHCGVLQPVPQFPVRDSERITTPEEVREEANLAILHEIKGIFYFVLPSNPSSNPIGMNIPWGEFWDEKFVPFDAPYKEYVYNRYNVGYSSPDSLSPFWDNTHTVYDPFRTLGPKPIPLSSAKGWENYYKWKYAPFARNWDSLKSLNNELHTITPHLRNIWKVGQRITRVVPDFQGPPGPPLPEYVTFADSIYHNPPNYYAFLVSKDFGSTQWGDSVIVNLPTPPQGQTYYVLDLNSRHLIPSSGRIKFHTVLKSGEGRLFKFVLAGNPQRGGVGPLQAGYVPNPYNGSMWNTLLVTDPDLSFQKYPTGGFPPNVQFTEGDTVVLTATVYNLGFANQTDSVLFYDGDPLYGGTPLGGSYVTVPGLSTSDTLVKSVTVNVNWITNSGTALGPHDINVILKGATSSAHSLLWLNAQDYATKVNGSPWNMDETKQYQDIASYANFVDTTDSISSCWEGKTGTLPALPTLHFRLANSIDASKYKVMQFKVFSDSAESVTVRYSPQQIGSLPGMTFLPAYQWQVVTVNLGLLSSWGGSVTDFYLQFPMKANRNIRLAWAKLTTR